MGLREFMERSQSTVVRRPGGGMSTSTACSNSSHNSHHSNSQVKVGAAQSFRISQLVGDNPPLGSIARVVRRKYQSIARERELEYTEDDDDLDAVVMYEVEFPKNPSTALIAGHEKNMPLGIELETDFYGNHAVVKYVKRGSVAYSLSKVIQPGHIVVAVNGKDLSKMSFQQVLVELKTATTPRVIRFLDPLLLPLHQMVHEKILVNRDQYGFAKDDRYILSYRKQVRKRKITNYENEKRWVEFTNIYGGLDEIDSILNPTKEQEEEEEEDDDDEEEEEKEEIKELQASIWKKLRQLVLAGIPIVLRPKVWSILAQVRTYKSQYPTSHFTELLAKNHTSPSLVDIEKDIHRTYPEHLFFQSEKGKKELRRVLLAYSLHNPSIGYCQSMNFLTGMMLLFMNEEEAFWLLCRMMEILPCENYLPNMMGTQTDQFVFQQLVQQELPQVFLRLEKSGIQIQLITLHWFLCAFVCTLPTESALRVWDWFFLDGQEILFTVAIGILKLAEEKILFARNISEIHLIVRELGTDIHDEEMLMHFLYQMTGLDQKTGNYVVKEEEEDDNVKEEEEEEEKEEEPRKRTSINGLQNSLASSLRLPLFKHLLQANSTSLQTAWMASSSSSSSSNKKKQYRKQFTMQQIEEMRQQIRSELLTQRE